jgi:hypothetical protein
MLPTNGCNISFLHNHPIETKFESIKMEQKKKKIKETENNIMSKHEKKNAL